MPNKKYTPTAKDKAFAEKLAAEQRKTHLWKSAWQVERTAKEDLEKEVIQLKGQVSYLNSLLEEMTGCTHDEILDYIAEKRRTNDNISFVRKILDMGGMYND